MKVLKYCWSNSLVKLMHNCSNELVSKNSNPKISSTPQNNASSTKPMERFVRITMCVNTTWYKCRARASRLSVACCTVFAMRMTPSPGVRMVLVHNTSCSFPTVRPNNSAAASSGLPGNPSGPSGSTCEPSLLFVGAMKPMFPTWSTVATARRTSWISDAAKPTVRMAARVASKSRPSSARSKATPLDRRKYLKSTLRMPRKAERSTSPPIVVALPQSAW
mmetsp:Transcript_37712/g.108845  ORF Transcript_37712/g.108845 Transcript_37712/m.108845 type:complete len:220 (-) Transcript_37712:123-782(-)